MSSSKMTLITLHIPQPGEPAGDSTGNVLAAFTHLADQDADLKPQTVANPNLVFRATVDPTGQPPTMIAEFAIASSDLAIFTTDLASEVLLSPRNYCVKDGRLNAANSISQIKVVPPAGIPTQVNISLNSALANVPAWIAFVKDGTTEQTVPSRSSVNTDSNNDLIVPIPSTLKTGTYYFLGLVQTLMPIVGKITIP